MAVEFRAQIPDGEQKKDGYYQNEQKAVTGRNLASYGTKGLRSRAFLKL